MGVPRIRILALASGAVIALACAACARGAVGGFASGNDETPYFQGVCDGGTCVQSACVTTISGTAYAPNAIDPLYGALVYVPGSDLAPFEEGATCARCDIASGDPIASATSAPDGSFTIELPHPNDIDLVVQIGKWRRRATLPPLVPCTDNPLDRELTRLPRSQREGNIPLHAVTTGNCDRLECVLRAVGVDDSEFTIPSGGGRIHMYRQNGATMPGIPSADSLTADLDTMRKYDVVLFDCAGEQDAKSRQQKQNVVDFTSTGGRVFASHFSYVWLYDTLPFSTTAEWNLGVGIPQELSIIGKLDTSFERGAAFASWMTRVGAISSEGDNTIEVFDPRFDVTLVSSPAQRLIYTDTPGSVQEFTFDTPIGVPPAQQCGRVSFTDFHVTGAACTPDGLTFPNECESSTSKLSPQERVMEFMLFDLASCPQGNGSKPPVIIR